ncbi:hypothetical protein MKEN_00457700 [Mycena kentingensis (nom. inval.)]|nr:hypothetical protein MKEN_00457700 [Mycena kentingensis (nom. inval.)]
MPLTGLELRQANLLLGPWLIGTCLDLLLQGVLSCQFVNYFTWYRDDMPTLRLTVVGLVLLTVLKSIQSFALSWIQFIPYFGDLEGAILLSYTTWWQSGNPLMVAIIGFYVQNYFCFRLWVISKSWYVVAPIYLLFVFAFLAICVATYFISVADGPKIGAWFACHLASVFAADIILSLTTAYFLIKSKKDVLPQTVGMISALVRLTFQTAAPAALCAMFNLIFSQLYPGGDAIISTAFNMALPKLYAISMMWTLNARRSIRVAHSSRNGMTNTTSNEPSGGRSRAPRRTNGGDVELGAIQVLTQTETTQHIDVRDMFDRTGRDLKSGAGGEVDTKGGSDGESVQLQYTAK